jgi:hypothetical protein
MFSSPLSSPLVVHPSSLDLLFTFSSGSGTPRSSRMVEDKQGFPVSAAALLVRARILDGEPGKASRRIQTWMGCLESCASRSSTSWITSPSPLHPKVRRLLKTRNWKL